MMFDCTDDEDYLDLDFDDNSEGNSSESSDDDISIVVKQADNRCKRTTFSKVKPKSILEQDSSDFEDEMEYELSQNIESLKRNLSSSETKKHLAAAGSEPTTKATTSVASTSGNGNDDGEHNNNTFYNDIYFDSDEEDTSNEKQSKRNKYHKVMSNDELFYDPTMDAKDQLWMDERRRNPHKTFSKFMPPPGSKTKPTKTDRPKLTAKTKAGTGNKSVRFNLADGNKKSANHKSSKIPKRPTSDALLDCPACMTTICVDCQRHERYPNQYRAMFVMNCSVDYSENLTYPNFAKSSKKMKQSSEKAKEVYHPVYCNECRTQVAVYDEEEIYHFFNVLSSYG